MRITRDAVTQNLPGKDNAGLRKIVRDLAHNDQVGIGYNTPETLTDIVGRKVALTASGRAGVLAAFKQFERECYGEGGAS